MKEAHPPAGHSLRLGRWPFHLIHRSKHRITKNEETEKYVPNERTRQNLRKNLNDMEISNLPGEEFRVMVTDAHHTQQKNGCMQALSAGFAVFVCALFQNRETNHSGDSRTEGFICSDLGCGLPRADFSNGHVQPQPTSPKNK